MYYTLANILIIIIFIQIEINANKTYFFNREKSNNEFRIYNRVNLNSSYNSEFDDNREISELRKLNGQSSTSLTNNNEDSKNILNGTEPFYPLLDEEWSINNINKSKLPINILQKIYQNVKRNNSAIEYRILLNSVQNASLIKFNLGSLKENVTEANLFFYFNATNFAEKEFLSLRLYQVVGEYNNSVLVNPDNHKFLSSIYIQKAKDGGWQYFSIRNVLNNWLNGENNDGILITISLAFEEKFVLFKDATNPNFRSYIVAQIKQNDSVADNTNKYWVSGRFGHCGKQNFHVDFKKLNWDNVVLQPDGFESAMCVGKCYKNDSTLTNHGRIISLMRKTKKNACCVPTKYLSLPIMFFDKFDNVGVKYYDNMIVAECSCR